MFKYPLGKQLYCWERYPEYPDEESALFGTCGRLLRHWDHVLNFGLVRLGPSFNLVVVLQHVSCGFYAICLSPFTPYSFPQLVTRVGWMRIIGRSWIAICRYWGYLRRKSRMAFLYVGPLVKTLAFPKMST